MQRMNVRYPNIALIGLLLVITLLSYKCWTLSTLNDDLRNEIEKLQAEIKISAMRQVQYENKNRHLQENVHELDEKEKILNHELKSKQLKLQEVLNTLKNSEQEINHLKDSLLMNDNKVKDLYHQIEIKDSKIQDLLSDSQHILSMKNDAEDALSERDSQINNLNNEIKQMKKEITLHMQNKMMSQSPSRLVKFLESKVKNLNPANLKPLVKHTVHIMPIGLQGMKFHPGMQMLPKESSNALRKKPKYSVSYLGTIKNSMENIINHNEIPKKDILNQETQVEQNNGKLPQDSYVNNEKNVLPLPHNLEENPDTAVDDEQKAVEDPSDDQDEEGKEIKHDFENNNADMYDNYEEDKKENLHVIKEENEPKGIGAAEISLHEEKVRTNIGQDDVNLLEDISHRGNEKFYEEDFGNKIHNLGKL